MAIDWFGDGYDSARAWTEGRGAPPEWSADGEAEEAPAQELDDAEVDEAASAELTEVGVVEGIVADHGAESASADTYDSSYDDYDPSLFQAQMMVMEAQNNANMMAISGIGGYHDTNYNGHMDYADMGCTNFYGGMGF